MSPETFLKSLELAVHFGDHVTLGGGEPTVHPKFFEYLDIAIRFHSKYHFDLPILVVTNGKLSGKARKLLDYVDNGAPLTVELSLDEWHDPIRPDIEQAFRTRQRQKEANRWSYSTTHTESDAGIRTVKQIVAVGRAADPARGIAVSSSIACCCETMSVRPTGLIYSCGCKHHLIGHVNEDFDLLSDYDLELAHTGGGLPLRTDLLIKPRLAA